MPRTPKLLLIAALLVISMTTLVKTLVDDKDRKVYALATGISHVALVVVGSTYARGNFTRRKKTTKS